MARSHVLVGLGLFFCALCVLCSNTPVRAAKLSVDVSASGLEPLEHAVVYAVPARPVAGRRPASAIMDQRERTFVPHVLAIETGTAVSFPNSDNIRHQVYSFSPPKRFQIPLYEGTPAEPIRFEKAGTLALGCNIHDRMSAYILVVDTPFFGRPEQGRVVFDDLPPGDYRVHLWHPRYGARGRPGKMQAISLSDAEPGALVFSATD